MKLSRKGIGFPMHVPRNLRTLASGQVAAAEPAITLMKSRRRIAFPKAQDHAKYVSITAGICFQRNGIQGSVCASAILSRSCPLWVKSRHWRA
jgi:hypothetical protein